MSWVGYREQIFSVAGGGSSGGSGAFQWRSPVPTVGDLSTLGVPSTTPPPVDGEARVVLSVDEIYIYDGTTDTWFPADGIPGVEVIWATFVADSGTTTATTQADTFTISGGTNITTSIAGKTITINSTAVATDELVKVSADDLTAGYLFDKIAAGFGIVIAEQNPSPNNETLQISVGTINSGNISDFDEAAQDAIGDILQDTSTIDLTYTDSPASITADIIDNSSTQKILVSDDGSSPVVSNRQEINFIDGNGIDITVTDNAGEDRADITIAVNESEFNLGAVPLGSIDQHNDVDTTTTLPVVGDSLVWDGASPSNWVPLRLPFALEGGVNNKNAGDEWVVFGNVPTNLSPIRLPYASKLIGIAVTTQVAKTFDVEIYTGAVARAGGTPVVTPLAELVVSASLSADTTGVSPAVDVDFTAGAELGVYLRDIGGANIDYPHITLWFVRTV